MQDAAKPGLVRLQEITKVARTWPLCCGHLPSQVGPHAKVTKECERQLIYKEASEYQSYRCEMHTRFEISLQLPYLSIIPLKRECPPGVHRPK